LQRSRTTGLVTTGLATAVLLLAYAALHRAPDPSMVSRWWLATAVATALLLVTPRRHASSIATVLMGAFALASLLAGRSLLFSAGFALGNVFEALTILWLLAGQREGRPELRSWSDLRRWLLAVALGSLVCAVITALTLWADERAPMWRTIAWIGITHVGSQMVLLPMVMRRSRQRVRVSVFEVASHVVLLGVGAAACLTADADTPVTFLLLPLLMWAAARFSTRWAGIELAAIALGIAVLTALDHGPFLSLTGEVSLLDIAASSQTFVAVSAVTAVAFSVAMSHLRDSLRRIRENELQLGQLLDSASGTAFIATDLEGTITLFSPGAEQLLGYRADEVVGRTSPMPFHDVREVLTRARELDIAPGYEVVTHPVAQGAEQDTRDWTYVRRDKSRLTVSLSATAVRDDEGRPVSFLSVVRDVTDRRAAEQALVFALDKEREANHRMQDLDRAKSEFISAVSHELRTPLTSIVGYTELLSEGISGDLEPAQLDLVARIDRNGVRLLSLVEDLLTLAKVEEGNFEVHRERIDLRDAVLAGTDEVAVGRKEGVAFTVRLPDEPAMVDGDPVNLERLVVNLVGNALKFTPSGGSVSVSLEVNGDVGVLSVRDTGMGIPLAEQDRLFQRFFRSSLATEHAIQGTGLGLNIVRSIAEAHHGQVSFESEPGVGTVFRFSVPLSRTSNPARLPEPDRRA
jgi:PAS domain S-box-containing protein